MAQVTTSPSDDESALSFTITPTLQPTLYNAPVQTYLAANPTVTNPMASAAVFYHGSNTSEVPPRLLLLQRAPNDTLPLKWEFPGGSVDTDGTDPSIINGAVRELREETGLVAKRVVRELGEHREFYEEVVGEGRMLTWRMVIFEVEVGFEFYNVEELVEGEGEGKKEELRRKLPKVELEPDEHVRYLWCTEEEVRAGRCGDVELEFTDPDWRRIMLKAFELHRSGGS